MLFFIQTALKCAPDVLLFKYISCYSLSAEHYSSGAGRPQFKYISCYSLSVPITTIFFQGLRFKYISCYSLSEEMQNNAIVQYAFKYISCYSLSTTALAFRTGTTNLNTSHVILYQVASRLDRQFQHI